MSLKGGEVDAKYLVPETIDCERVLLRRFKEEDWGALCELFRDEECVRYTVRAPLADWQSWRTLASYLGHWEIRGYGPYAVVEKESGEMIGPVGLWCPGDWPEPEIKWSLRRRFWGKGYATESALAVKKMAATQLRRDRLISLILPENEASKKVAARVGGIYEKTIPFRDGKAEIFVYHL